MATISTADVLEARAALTDGRGGLWLDTLRVAPPARGEVRVRLSASGLCHTDHDARRWGVPLVLGHEGAGHVLDVGPGVTGLATGDRVVLNWAIPCGQCPQCVSGHAALCEVVRPSDPLGTPGGHAHEGGTRWQGAPIERVFSLGTLSEITLVRAAAVTPVPDGVPLSSACLVGCGVMTGVGSVLNVARVGAGESVAVLGCGGVGLNVIQAARIAGARPIIAIDARDEALARARRFGASDLLRVAADDSGLRAVAAEVRRLTGGRGADHAFEATGRAALAFAPLELIRNGGLAVQVSGSAGDAALDLKQFWWNKRLVVPLYGDCEPARDFPRLFEYYLRGELELDGLVSRKYPLTDVATAFDDMLNGRIAKGVITFAGGD